MTLSQNLIRSLCGAFVAALALGWAATVAVQFPAAMEDLCACAEKDPLP
jgi:hypothetical protein